MSPVLADVGQRNVNTLLHLQHLGLQTDRRSDASTKLFLKLPVLIPFYLKFLIT